MTLTRTTVLWLGASTPDAEFVDDLRSRNLTLVQISDLANVDFSASHLRWLICDGRERKFRYLKSLIDEGLEAALNNGVGISAVVDEEDVNRIRELLKGKWPADNDYKLIYEAINVATTFPNELAETIRRWEEAPWITSDKLKIIYAGRSREFSKTHSELQIFLERAFHDFTSVRVKDLPGGHMAEGVFEVDAIHRDDVRGKRPLFYFAKMDLRAHVTREKELYNSWGAPYIPFNLRPNLHLDKCLEGAKYSLLVGDFVDGSEGLDEVIKRGHGVPILHSLFDVTLLGWRLGRQPDSRPDLEERLLDFLRRRPITEDVYSTARSIAGKLKKFPQLKRPDELKDSIIEGKRIGKRYMSGIVHGDLHVGNVVVRGQDAVLIDFGSVNAGAPLIEDIARLEVSVALDLLRWSGVRSQWNGFLRQVYQPKYLRYRCFGERSLGARMGSPLSCIRQLRMRGFADQCESGQYAEMLAVQFLRQASFEHKGTKKTHERALAYCLACYVHEGLQEPA